MNAYRKPVSVFDEHGEPLVTRSEALDLLGVKPGRDRGWHELAHLPEPAGAVGRTLLWRRCDVAPAQQVLL